MRFVIAIANHPVTELRQECYRTAQRYAQASCCINSAAEYGAVIRRLQRSLESLQRFWEIDLFFSPDLQ